MRAKKTILIYNDSPVFGGHEIMTIKMANLLAEKYNVYFMFYHPEIKKRLKNKVRKVKINISSKTFLAGLRSLNIKEILNLRKLIKKTNPDLTIVSQGMVELCLKGAIASKSVGIKTISYIPLAFPSHLTKVKFGKIRDLFNKYFLKIFDAFITISEEQKKYLLNYWGITSKIYLLPNFVEVNPKNNNYTFYKPVSPLKLGIVARISFKQKRQDKLIEIAKILKNKGLNFKFVIIGDGPDKKKLVTMINKHNLNYFFSFEGWINDIEKIYKLFDILLITSDYEGVPMNMLEAIVYCKPIIAPKKGIFKEYLPDKFLYKNYFDIVKIINFILNNPNEVQNVLLDLKDKVQKLHSKNNFYKTLIEIINDV
ncbi:MAG: glycosyltransferase [Thermodesulfobacteria bacterium]|nr:glycosyltransferase [Thermodesulfobacteriota bacterium]